MARLMTPGEVATLLNVSQRTVYSLINRRDLVSVKIGRLVRVPEDAVTRYVDTHTRGKR